MFITFSNVSGNAIKLIKYTINQNYAQHEIEELNFNLQLRRIGMESKKSLKRNLSSLEEAEKRKEDLRPLSKSFLQFYSLDSTSKLVRNRN